MKAYQHIAQAFVAYQNCIKSGNHEWEMRHISTIHDIIEEHLPSGSGFDAGVQFYKEESRPDRLIFKTAFHHMDENGFYDGWTEHKIIVKPDLSFGFSLDVSGRNKNGIKEYIGEMFHHALNTEIDTSRTDLLAAVKECLPDLKHYAAAHGPGPDKRLAALQAIIEMI